MKTDQAGKHELEYAATVICDQYCKYPHIWDERKFGPLAESTICEDCPLNRLVEGIQVGDES